MTEKQFEFREVNCGAIIPKVYDNEKQQYANLFECVDWLNNLHEENMQLKQQREELFYHERDTKNEWRELKRENKELKEEHERLIDLLNKKLHENDDNDEYTRRVKINLIMELKKELGQ